MKPYNPAIHRPLKPSEIGIALTLSGALHYMIRQIDKLAHTSIFRQKVKQTGKAFLAEIEKHAEQQIWTESPDGADINQAAEQMENLADNIHNTIVLQIAIAHLPPGQMELFWQEMQKNFKRFEIPLRITEEGQYEFVDAK